MANYYKFICECFEHDAKCEAPSTQKVCRIPDVHLTECTLCDRRITATSTC